MLRKLIVVALTCAALAGCWKEREKPWFDMKTPHDEPVLIRPDQADPNWSRTR